MSTNLLKKKKQNPEKIYEYVKDVKKKKTHRCKNNKDVFTPLGIANNYHVWDFERKKKMRTLRNPEFR